MAKVLIVEDESDLRRLVVRELGAAGYEVCEAEDGSQGLQAILHEQPDLVLCDVSLPVMDGYELLRVLRAEHPELADLPFLFLSAFMSRQDIITALKVGADDYITKPLDYELLRIKVEARLRRSERAKAGGERGPVKPSAAPAGEAAPVEHAQAPQVAGTAAAPGTASRSADGASDAIADLVRLSDGQLVAGRVQTISMDAIRERVGDERWERLAERITRLAEESIRRHLAPGDLLRRNANAFIICFASASEREAEIRARLIAEDLWEQLFGELRDTALSSVGAEVHRLQITREEAAAADDLFDLITARINALAEEAKLRARETLVEIYMKGELAPRPVRLLSGQLARFAIAGFEPAAQARADRLLAGGGVDDAVLADLDALMLSRTMEHICCAVPGEEPMIAVPVHFSTLKNKQKLARYLGACGNLMPGLRERLIFRLLGVPERVSPADLAIMSLSAISRARILDLEQPRLGKVDLRNLRIALVALDYHHALPLLHRSPRALARAVRSAGAHLLIDRVPERALGRVQKLAPSFVALHAAAAPALLPDPEAMPA